MEKILVTFSAIELYLMATAGLKHEKLACSKSFNGDCLEVRFIICIQYNATNHKVGTNTHTRHMYAHIYSQP